MLFLLLFIDCLNSMFPHRIPTKMPIDRCASCSLCPTLNSFSPVRRPFASGVVSSPERDAECKCSHGTRPGTLYLTSFNLCFRAQNGVAANNFVLSLKRIKRIEKATGFCRLDIASFDSLSSSSSSLQRHLVALRIVTDADEQKDLVWSSIALFCLF